MQTVSECAASVILSLQLRHEKERSVMTEPIFDKQDDENLPHSAIRLGGETILYQADLAAIFSRDPSNIWRAVKRGELPPPIRMFGNNIWTAGSIIEHIRAAEEKGAQEREKEATALKHKVAKLRP